MTKNDQSGVLFPAAVPASWADPVIVPPPESTVRRWGPLVLWLGCLLAAVALLQWLGDGSLAVPSVTAPVAWWTWVSTGDPLTVAMGLLRVLALGLAWYLTGVTFISVLARVLRAARLVRVADALSFGPVRVLAQQAVGVGLAAGVLVTAVPAGPATPRATSGPVDVAVMVPVDDAARAPAGLALQDPVPAPVPAPVSSSTPASAAEEPVPTPSMAAEGTPPTSGAEADTVSESAAPQPAIRQRERQVEPGDHFWSIAADEVTRHLGRAATELEVLAHWEVLVEANADRLVVAGNPDLLLPGQRLLLPEVAS